MFMAELARHVQHCCIAYKMATAAAAAAVLMNIVLCFIEQKNGILAPMWIRMHLNRRRNTWGIKFPFK